jgi:hypothetical protein
MSSAFDVAKERPGIGAMHMRILHLISQGYRHPKAIAPRLTDYAGKKNVHTILRGLASRDYVREGRGGIFTLTSKASWLLPKAPLAAWQTTNYVPPARPPRRSGSDHSYLPSLAGDRFYDYVRHV